MTQRTDGGQAVAPSAEQVRLGVVTTADALYYRRGIHSVGMDDLRTGSGLSLKALYGLFPSKNAIVLAVLEKRHHDWTSAVAERVDATDGAREKLLAIFDYLVDWCAEDSFRGCGFVNAVAEVGAGTPHVAEIARQHKESFGRFVAELVRDAGGPDELAPQLAILAEGAQVTAAISQTKTAALQARRAAEVLIGAAFGD